MKFRPTHSDSDKISIAVSPKYDAFIRLRPSRLASKSHLTFIQRIFKVKISLSL